MYLRKLQQKDAPLMLSWMHDENVVAKMSADFMHKGIEDCLSFIEMSKKDESREIHRAICTEEDEYLGTVSLKNISLKNGNAEYAIVMRTKGMGSGAARYATGEILRIAFEELGLHKVYLYVKSGNRRARKFYDKIGFRQEGVFLEHVKEKQGDYEDMIWLAMLDREFKEQKNRYEQV